jgi:predicted NUDIX family NTP pyrophosphohydrolase
MTPASAGLLVFRRRQGRPEFLLVHPGGPFWRGKDVRGWSFPKGRVRLGEQPLAAAKREFREETGFEIDAPASALTPVKRPGRGWAFCWLVEADLDLEGAQSNTFDLQDKGGTSASFPEIDAYAYCPPTVALRRIHKSLLPILEEALRRPGVVA